MKIYNLLSRNRSSDRWISFAAAGLLAVAVAGCGGGGSDAPAATTTTTGTTATGGPTGTTVLTTALASPTTTNTEANPNQAFGLITAAGAAPVVVNSPPVVNFTVIDSTGKFVSGLKLVNTTSSAAGLAADPNCSQNNMSFAMAKWDSVNGQWQSLISRQRYAKDDLTARYQSTDTSKLYPTYRYSVVEGVVDPKPTAPTTVTKADGTTVASFSFANPDTAVADPSTRIVGILEENATSGYYTYRFATDVTTPLLMADATDVKSLSLGKVANNGNVAVKDGKTIHRLGAQLCYTDSATKAKVVVNPYIDFTIAADGSVTPVKAADGKTLAPYRQVVDKTSCNECHSKLAIHGGGRVDPNYCVICHNAGSTDYNTSNAIDLKLMVHRIHMGKELPKDYQVQQLRIKHTDKNGAITGTGYPQDVKNCVKCHTGTAAAAGSLSGTVATQDGDNWKKVPSRNACGACHNGIDFAKNTGVTLADAAKGLTTSTIAHIGGAKADDTQCALCHGATEIPTYHATVHTSNPTTGAKVAAQKSLPSGAAKIDYEISSVTVSGTPKRATVVFRILKNGSAVTFNTFAAGGTVLMTGFTGGPSIYLGYAVPQDGNTAPADFNASASSSVQNLWDGTKGTLTGPDANGYYTAVLGKTTSNGLDIPASAVMVTAFMGYGSFTQTTGLDTTAYPVGLVLPSQAVQKVATGYTARRSIVANAKCNVCHEQLGVAPYFHSGARNDATACALCHNPNRTSSGWSADSGAFVHGIHASSKRTVDYTWHSSSWTDGKLHFKNIGYPGVLKNCETCHVAGSYDFSATANSTAIAKALYRTVGQGYYNNSTTVLTTARTFDANGVDSNGGSQSLSLQSQASVDQISPYVKADNATAYGIGFSYTAYRAAAAAKAATATTMALPAVVSETDVTRAAAATTLVNSPIANACFACHDSKAAQTHMSSDGGGSLYEARATALLKTENCLFCHGAGKLADIKVQHQ